ncbi:MAG TPA: hypothetical protein DEQ40_00625 [Oxalobacteraceae bacterium]|nr:hypothetical protein [Oxalobacteraceae bacterium]
MRLVDLRRAAFPSRTHSVCAASNTNSSPRCRAASHRRWPIYTSRGTGYWGAPSEITRLRLVKA